ncbi:MAG: 5-methylcytosine-specific restriction enzyme [Thermoleophilaceae bacterium]|nr:5-methylcytosine-specific restriction enzyme [Thermoleophilaceae bacterium]
MARSRKDAWLRDELILALDLYQREGRNPSAPAVEELSNLLRAIPVEPELASEPTFRNLAGVRLKVSNFVAIDPSAEAVGMTRGGRGDQAVWDEFGTDPLRLGQAAEAIRANLDAIPAQEAEADEEEVADAPEGRLLTRVHRVRERNQRLVARKKVAALENTGKLACEACTFDFAATYGPHGDGFIECHHTVPLHTLRPGSRTRLADLALVCSNCHRMIHRRAEWLSVSALRALVGAATPG